MKKSLAILVAAMLLAATACRGSEASESLTTASQEVSQTAPTVSSNTVEENNSHDDSVAEETPGTDTIVVSETPGISEAATEPLHLPHIHSYLSFQSEPTCTESGFTEYRCNCGASYTNEDSLALGHCFSSEVVPPTLEEAGYTCHICQRCGYTYCDTYTEPIPPSRWDSEEAVAALCAEANAYIASVGCVVDPSAGCWCAPRYTGVPGVDRTLCYQAVCSEIDTYRAEGKTHLYVYFLPYGDAFQIYVAYSIVISG